MRADVLLALAVLVLMLGFTLFAVVHVRMVEDLAGQNAMLRERVDRLERENAVLSQRLDASLRLLQEKLRDASRFESLYTALKEENEALRVRVQRLEGENAVLQQRVENVTAERETYHAALRACIMQLDVYKQRAEACQSASG